MSHEYKYHCPECAEDVQKMISQLQYEKQLMRESIIQYRAEIESMYKKIHDTEARQK